MDKNTKVALAVVAGVVVFFMLLGGALAVPLVVRAAGGFHAFAGDDAEVRAPFGMGPGMMLPHRDGDSDDPDAWRFAPHREYRGPDGGEFGQQQGGEPPCGGDPGSCSGCPRSTEPSTNPN